MTGRSQRSETGSLGASSVTHGERLFLFDPAVGLKRLAPVDAQREVARAWACPASYAGVGVPLFGEGDDRAATAPVVEVLHPPSTTVGGGFNMQPDGSSAFALTCSGATPWSIVVFEGTPLLTTFGGASLLTAVAPAHLLRSAGACEVSIFDRGLSSNVVRFEVRNE